MNRGQDRCIPRIGSRTARGHLALLAALALALTACESGFDAPRRTPAASPFVVEGMGAFGDCGDCHLDMDEVFREGDMRFLTFTHEMHLETASGVSDCSSCHPPDTHDSDRVNRPTMESCFTCHLANDPNSCVLCHIAPHLDRGRCTICHTLKSWASRFDHSPELVAAHAKLPCDKCHTQATDAAMGYPAGCIDCHEPPHPLKIGALDLTRCAECHTTTGWRPTTFVHPASDCIDCHGDHHNDPQRSECQLCHSQTTWAGAKHTPTLMGAHQQVPCTRCHTLATGTTMGYPAGCVDCHRPPHPLSLAGKDLRRCWECHTITRWYPTTFQHPTSGCIDCHGDHHNDPNASECQQCHSQRTWSGATHPSRDCTDCHKRGEYHSGLSSSCQGCHVTGEYWVPSTYEHPQVGEHYPEGTPPLKCIKCHPVTYAEVTCKCHEHGGKD